MLFASFFFSTSFAALVAAKPTVVSNILSELNKSPSSNGCTSSQFWYETRSCCLENGGPPSPPPPPPAKQCPPTNYYWHTTQECCVPRNKPPSTPQPPPQCNTNWGWNEGSQCCEPQKNPPSPQPSQKPYDTGKGYARHKRLAAKSRGEDSFCPLGFHACPISSLIVPGGSEFECVDTYSDLTSCGGCSSIGQGQNCAVIEGAWNVGCEAGSCKIYSCAGGFHKSSDGLSCLAL